MKSKKKVATLTLTTLLLITATGLTGCHFDDTSNSLKTKIEEKVEQSLNHEIKYDESLKDFDNLELEIDMDVTDLTLISTKDTQFIFEQQANNEELLATYDFKSDDSTAKITIKNKTKLAFKSPIKNSKATLTVPEHLFITFLSEINVGDVKIEDTNLHFNVLESKIDVGTQSITLEDNDKLTDLSVTSNVGDLTLTLKGLHESLSSIIAKSNVGDVMLHMDGSIKNALTVIQSANVGDVKGDFRGSFEAISYELSTDTGDVTLSLPKDFPVALKIDKNEFTTDVEMKGIAYEMDGDDLYFISNPSRSKDNLFEVRTNVGDIIIRSIESFSN